MLYGSLYKVFLKLSKHKNINKNKYNELTIPKIFVKILLNKEKKNMKNYYKFEEDSDFFTKENHDFNFFKVNNTTKAKDNRQYNSLIKNHYMSNLDFSLPKIKFKKEIPLIIPKKESSKSKEKNDFIISDTLKQIKNSNESLTVSPTKKLYKNQNINNIRKIKIQRINDCNKNNNDESSLNNSNKKEKICNLKYRIKLNNIFEYRDLENNFEKQNFENELKDNISETILNPKDNKRNIINMKNKNQLMLNMERNKDNKIFSKINSFKDKNRIKLSKILIKDKDKEKDNDYFNIKSKKTFNFPKQKTEFLTISTLNFKKYSKIDDIDKLLSKNELKNFLFKNLFQNNDIFYFKCKMYKNQLKEYFSHRINWCLISNNNNETINFEWKYFSNKINYKEYKYDSTIPIKKLKMINLFEKNYEIGNKKYMFLNLIKYCDKENINVFEIVPFTIIINNSNNIDDSLDKIKKIMNLIEKNKLSNKDLISNQKYNEIFDDDKFYESLKNQYIYINKNFLSLKNYWIIKPTDLYQGKCIEICNSFDDLVKISKKIFKGVNQKLIPEQLNITTNIEDNNDIIDNNNSTEKLITLNNIHNNNIKKKIIKTRMYCTNEIIVQKYLDNPLLYKNRKFDIRCFVLLDSNFNLYFCKEGHLKGSSELYNLNNSNKFIHITNYSLQKNSNKFELYEIGNEMSYKDFKNYLINENISLDKFNYMINQMKLLIKISFKSVSKKLLKNKKNILCFEIFGYDFILDNDFKLWILEINNNPGLSISSPVIEKLVPRMMDDAFRLTLDKVFNTKYSNECIDINGEYKTKYKLNGFSDNENIFEFLCNIS
jgi:hypothetical protein